MNKTITTPIKYFKSSKIESIPWEEKVFAIKQKIPSGAIFIKTSSIFKTKSFNLKTISKRTLFCLMLAMHPPNKIAKKIICNISPSTKDLNGFSGIIFKKTDPIDGGELIFKIFSSETTETELPGSRIFPTDKEIVIAVSYTHLRAHET